MASVNIVVHPDWDITERVVVGEVTIDDVVTELQRFYSGVVTQRVLWDFSQATFNNVHSVDVERVSVAAASLVKARPGGKSAVVAPSDLAYGFSRMYQGYHEIHQVSSPYRSFRTRQEAIDWLLA